MLEVGVDFIVQSHDGLLPVLLSPPHAGVPILLHHSHLVNSVDSLHWELIDLGEVLLNLRLAEVGRAPEGHLVLIVRLRTAHQHNIVVQEINLLRRLLEV